MLPRLFSGTVPAQCNKFCIAPERKESSIRYQASDLPRGYKGLYGVRTGAVVKHALAESLQRGACVVHPLGGLSAVISVRSAGQIQSVADHFAQLSTQTCYTER